VKWDAQNVWRIIGLLSFIDEPSARSAVVQFQILVSEMRYFGLFDEPGYCLSEEIKYFFYLKIKELK
jgi:hypothetical protein